MRLFKFASIGKTFLSLSLIFLFTAANGQTKVVRGTVTTFTDLPVGNVEVTAKESGSSVKTLADGSFTIVTNEKDVLLFKGIVFEDKKAKIKKSMENVDVSLDFIETPENIEMAVGYGYVSSLDNLNAASKAYSDQGFCNFSDIFELIRAQFPGVSINGDCVALRGVSSINSGSCAMYIVDGQILNSISYIVPCDVKSIDVIKDSGSSIYGAQGANGVILITTK